MTLWRITGEAENGSNGGQEIVYAITDGPSEPPDPHMALREADPRRTWYDITEIKQIQDGIRLAWEECTIAQDLLLKVFAK